MNSEKRKELQQKCLREVQAFLGANEHSPRDRTKTFTDQPSRDTEIRKSKNPSAEKRERERRACLDQVRAFLEKPSAKQNPVLSEKEMIQALKDAGYSLRNGNIINRNGKVVTPIKPFKNFKTWYLEWLEAQKLDRQTKTQPSEPEFQLRKDAFPPISN